jgi:hypothetical protein
MTARHTQNLCLASGPSPVRSTTVRAMVGWSFNGVERVAGTALSWIPGSGLRSELDMMMECQGSGAASPRVISTSYELVSKTAFARLFQPPQLLVECTLVRGSEEELAHSSCSSAHSAPASMFIDHQWRRVPLQLANGWH